MEHDELTAKFETINKRLSDAAKLYWETSGEVKAFKAELTELRKLVADQTALLVDLKAADRAKAARRKKSSADEFLATRCVVSSALVVPKDELYRAYRDWCEEEGISIPVPANSFGRSVFRRAKEARVTRLSLGAKRVQAYQGIALGS